MQFITILIYALLIILILFFVNKFLKKFKIMKFNSLVFFDGGVKSGKTTFALASAITQYGRNLRKWKIWKFFDNVFNFKKKIEMPLFYSNIPLKIPYVPLTYDILMRRKRTRFKSVIFIDEASLLADSQLIRDIKVNNQLLLFNKLIGHSTHGGTIFYNSQSTQDIHYSVKRCISEFVYVHHMVKWIPFILVVYVREDRMSDGVINVNTSDVEDTLRKVIISKRVWRLFDTYSFSSFTDNLPVEDNVVKAKSLKVDKMLSFREDFNDLEIK